MLSSCRGRARGASAVNAAAKSRPTVGRPTPGAWESRLCSARWRRCCSVRESDRSPPHWRRWRRSVSCSRWMAVSNCVPFSTSDEGRSVASLPPAPSARLLLPAHRADSGFVPALRQCPSAHAFLVRSRPDARKALGTGSYIVLTNALPAARAGRREPARWERIFESPAGSPRAQTKGSATPGPLSAKCGELTNRGRSLPPAAGGATRPLASSGCGGRACDVA